MKPLLVDLCCAAGGATRGYMDAGFRVLGVDHKAQPRHCGDGFVRMDVFEFLDALERGEYERPAAFHVSPPCQGYSIMRYLPWLRGRDYPLLIAPIRERLQVLGVPWVIENVMGAKLPGGWLCGAMFNLPFYRHRAFETSFPWFQPGHPKHQFAVKPGRGFGASGDVVEQRMAPLTPWMTRMERRQAIPPAYTQYIGQYLMAAVQSLGEKGGTTTPCVST